MHYCTEIDFILRNVSVLFFLACSRYCCAGVFVKWIYSQIHGTLYTTSVSIQHLPLQKLCVFDQPK